MDSEAVVWENGHAKPAGSNAGNFEPLSLAAIAKKAYKDESTLKEAAVALGYVSADDFDRWIDPKAMTFPNP